MKTLNKILFGIICAALIVAPFLGYEVYAQTSSQTKLSPTIYEVTTSQGQTKTVEIAIANDSDHDITYSVSIFDFKPMKNGQPQILLGDEQNSSYSLKNWFGEFAKSITVSAQSTKSIQLPYSVPQNALNQTYYGAVFIKPVSVSPENEPSPPSLGALLFVNVGNTTTDTVPQINFDVTEQTEGSLVTGFTFSVEVFNKGNYKITPRVYVDVLNPTGEVINTIEISTIGSVLPDSSRIYSQTKSADAIDVTQPWVFRPVVETGNIKVRSSELDESYTPKVLDITNQKMVKEPDQLGGASVYIFYTLAAIAVFSVAINVAVVFIKK